MGADADADAAGVVLGQRDDAGAGVDEKMNLRVVDLGIGLIVALRHIERDRPRTSGRSSRVELSLSWRGRLMSAGVCRKPDNLGIRGANAVVLHADQQRRAQGNRQHKKRTMLSKIQGLPQPENAKASAIR